VDLGITGKTALITGASAGLGYAAALTLAGEWVKIAINSRSMENLKKASKSIQSATGQEPFVVAGDLGHEGTVDNIIREVELKLGSIDILVSNAGGPPAGPFDSHDKETWRTAADLTLHSAIDLSRAVLPDMVKNGWGRIIFITSIAVKQPADSLIISNTLRAGLTGFAKSISNEYGKAGVTVNTVCPGYTKTERLEYLADSLAKAEAISKDQVYERWIESVPAGRLGKPEELAGLITFLASEKASYITGLSILVDGGAYKGLL
jgi:3-oxoacyl-[acyl-carrier protein] reductase